MKDKENLQSFILQDYNVMPYYTYLNKIFDALQERQNDYNWLITNIDLNHYPDMILKEEKVWISGEELTRIVYTHDIQFIWSVLSGFEKEVIVDINNLEIEPFADGNKNFWIEKPQIQHPLAKVEMVCWDSSLFLLLSKDDIISERFKRSFSTADNLVEYNKSF